MQSTLKRKFCFSQKKTFGYTLMLISFLIFISISLPLVFYNFYLIGNKLNDSDAKDFIKNNKDFPLLIVSFDGFRWNYLNRTSTPHFDHIISNGVFATNGLTNEFATSTLTNHWSMVTGLHPEDHGIIENEMFDPVINKSYIPLYKDKFAVNDPRFYNTGVEPIWVTNQLQKKYGRSGSIMWWGAENEIKGIHPTYHMPFNLEVGSKVRIDTMIGWLSGENPVNLGLLYFSEPDHTAHAYGPDSENVTKMIQYADHLTGYLLEQLEKKSVLDEINIIITSDHGFASVSKSRLINLDKFVDPSLYHMVHYTPVAAIIPKEGQEEFIYEQLKANSERNHFHVYKKSDIPERLHYKKNIRVTPIIAVADISYSFISNMSEENFKQRGTHGYDNIHEDMRPFFMAIGPSFKKNFKVDTFLLVDIYPLMCHLLNLQPAPNNGSMNIVSLLLHNDNISIFTYPRYIAFFLVLSGILVTVTGTVCCCKYKYSGNAVIKSGLKKSSLHQTSRLSSNNESDSYLALLADEADESHYQ
ncbi:unnamed protein product [Lymnaea stagnalis]|uniref:Uncharacterized protein n=1 Tax=Lymnaea stagnalis TaxID=6523 RepID=A0AAV2HWX4_LYMST